MDTKILTKPVFWLPLLASIILCYFFVDLPVSILLDHFDHHHPGLSKIFSEINNAGKANPYLIASVFVFAWAVIIAKNKKLAWVAVYFFLTILIASAVCDIFKILAGRGRPFEYFSYDIYGFYLWELDNNFWSFPSGHATCMAAITSAAYLVLRRYGILFLCLFLLIFCGRVITRAHYISDVMAGGYLGFLAAYWTYYFMRKKITSCIKISSIPKNF